MRSKKDRLVSFSFMNFNKKREKRRGKKKEREKRPERLYKETEQTM
jgi:hypothetical protein